MFEYLLFNRGNIYNVASNSDLYQMLNSNEWMLEMLLWDGKTMGSRLVERVDASSTYVAIWNIMSVGNLLFSCNWQTMMVICEMSGCYKVCYGMVGG